jgi:hypothetical protein
MKQILTFLTLLFLIAACETRPPIPFDSSTEPRGLTRVKPTTTTGKQLALVIGNSQYEFSELANPKNDATDITGVLRKMGFEVTLKTDLNQVAMGKAIRQFSTRLSRQPGVGLFYFAGHGTQVDGQNYLLPIDNNKIGDKHDLASYAINVNDHVLARMKEANNQLNIVILDACRDNPFRGFKRSLGRGLAKVESSRGTIIAFATAPGDTASDVSIGKRNGLFTKYLLNGLKKAQKNHQRIDDMFMEVSNGVIQESGNDQEPWYSASLRKPFCFGGCQKVTSVAAVQPQPITTSSQPSQPTPSIQHKLPPVAITSVQQPIASSYSSVRYTDNGDGTVTDNRSGLIWLKNANCFGRQNWERAMQSAANLANGQCGLRDGSMRGMWRLPTREEGEAMIDEKYKKSDWSQPTLSNAAGTGPWKEGDAFSGVQANSYWSSTTDASYTGIAWGVYLDYGNVNRDAKGYTYYVWPVRGGV